MADKFNVRTETVQFVSIVFLLLAALFGMIIMAFIFGNLGPANAGLVAGSTAFNTSQAIQNNSLGAIETYSEQADTQFNTAAIAVTLLILLSLFILFWRFFMGSQGAGGRSGGGSFT